MTKKLSKAAKILASINPIEEKKSESLESLFLDEIHKMQKQIKPSVFKNKSVTNSK